jgi:CHASE2 domain-containing sensor protein
VLDPGRVWAWTTLGPLLAAAAVLFLTVIDPFEIESASNRQSAKILYKAYAALYPQTMRDNITLVFLDNATLTDQHQTWPVDHALHASVLESIRHYKPAAVLVDLFFLQARKDDLFDLSKKQIELYKAEGIPLLLIAGTTESGAIATLRPEITKDDAIIVSPDVSGLPGEDRSYRLTPAEGKYPAAAWALYQGVCNRHAEGVALAAAGDARLKWIPDCAEISKAAAPYPMMEVVWGLKPADWNCQFRQITERREACDEGAWSFGSRLFQLLWASLIPVQDRHIDPLPVSYHAEVSTVDVIHGEKHEDLAPLLTGKVVIYGSHIPPVIDLVNTPVQGPIDGAFIHAMALDNLLTWGRGYIHRSPLLGTTNKELTEFEPAAVMLVVSIVVMVHRRRLIAAVTPATTVEYLREQDERWLRVTRWCIYVFMVGVGYVQTVLYGFSPMNWLGLFVVVHVAHWIEKWFFRKVVRELHAAGSTAAYLRAVRSEIGE